MTTKGNFPHLDVAKLILFIVCLAICWGFLFSCRPVKETVTEYQTITIHDTIKGPAGENIIVTRDSIIEVQKETIKTRWKTRFETKRFNDSLKHVRSIYTDSLRYALRSQKIVVKYKYKEVKQEVKKEKKKSKRLILIPFVLLLILLIIYSLRKL